jgi:hypothetical protein
MNELSVFERRLAAGLEAVAGPRRSVDAAAIAQTASSRPTVRGSVLSHLSASIDLRARPRSTSAGRLRDRLNLALVAAAAVLVLAVASLTLNRFAPSVGRGPTPTPTPTATQSPSRAPSPSPYACGEGVGTCRGNLQPGTYATEGFRPAFSYTVPFDWQNDVDVHSMLVLLDAAGGQYTYPDGATFRDGIYVYRAPAATAATSETVAKGVGKKARDLAQWLSGHADLVASSPIPVSIGGATGFRVDVALPTRARTRPDRCTDHGEPRCESLFISNVPGATPGGPDWFSFGIVGPESEVIYLLDAPSGDTVMVVIDDVDGVDRDALIAAATPIVNSFVFTH